MATVDENKYVWGDWYTWDESGAEWSGPWGSADMQWYGAICPRIHHHLPARTILEIAPGHGRWTHYLKDLCRSLIVVDLSESCIDVCRERFKESQNIEYYVNDGKSLEMIKDHSVDFIFSYDSLVHAEEDVIEIYLKQFAAKLSEKGSAFIHHSNLLEVNRRLTWHRLFPRKMRNILKKQGISSFNDHWRAPSVSADVVRKHAESHGLICTSQEKVNWGTDRLIDCMSVITRKKENSSSETRAVENYKFMKEAGYLAMIGKLYTFSK